MERRLFIKNVSLISAGAMSGLGTKLVSLESKEYKSLRPSLSERKFMSRAVEEKIREVQKSINNPELAWVFENCFPNTLDTTVFYTENNGIPDTYIITGDIDAMWLRDSTAQVWPYLPLVNADEELSNLVKGLIYRQAMCITKDPYANAFYNDDKRVGYWKSDLTKMQPGIHERKWEIDSLCYPIRLSYHYWKKTGETNIFDATWFVAMKSGVKTFKDQQRKNDNGSYTFQRKTKKATDTLPLKGYGNPVKPVGLICSSFRPSDDATIYPFLIPSNYFALVSLRQLAEMSKVLFKDIVFEKECKNLANEVEIALEKYAISEHLEYGRILAFEVDGFGNKLFMDDANIPSLLSLPYLDCIDRDNEIYKNTRNFILSEDNPYFWKGKYAEGIGGPHVGIHMIWPMSIIMRGLTSTNENEIKTCIEMLINTHGGTGFMHESFYKDDPSRFSREWFAWANTLFGEFIIKVHTEYPEVLKNV